MAVSKIYIYLVLDTTLNVWKYFNSVYFIVTTVFLFLTILQWQQKKNTTWIKLKWNECGFMPPLCTYRLNWVRRTSCGWWDKLYDTALQTHNSKFEPWRSEAEHSIYRSLKLNIESLRVSVEERFCFFETWRMSGARTPDLQLCDVSHKNLKTNIGLCGLHIWYKRDMCYWKQRTLASYFPKLFYNGLYRVARHHQITIKLVTEMTCRQKHFS